jgi:hypothetical protein
MDNIIYLNNTRYRLIGYADGCTICRGDNILNYGIWIGKNIQYIMNDIQQRYEELFEKKMDYQKNKYDHELMIECLNIYSPNESGYCKKCTTFYIDMDCNCTTECDSNLQENIPINIFTSTYPIWYDKHIVPTWNFYEELESSSIYPKLDENASVSDYLDAIKKLYIKSGIPSNEIGYVVIDETCNHSYEHTKKLPDRIYWINEKIFLGRNVKEQAVGYIVSILAEKIPYKMRTKFSNKTRNDLLELWNKSGFKILLDSLLSRRELDSYWWKNNSQVLNIRPPRI